MKSSLLREAAASHHNPAQIMKSKNTTAEPPIEPPTIAPTFGPPLVVVSPGLGDVLDVTLADGELDDVGDEVGEVELVGDDVPELELLEEGVAVLVLLAEGVPVEGVQLHV